MSEYAFYNSQIQLGGKQVEAQYDGIRIGDCHNESHALRLNREEALKLAEFIRVCVKEKQP